MALQILLCPIYFNGYNESLVALNSEHYKDQCKGTADWSVDPPIVKFNFSLTEEAIAACSNTLTVGYVSLSTPTKMKVHTKLLLFCCCFIKVTQETGTGVFADFSNVQYINISGMICSHDPATGAITYHQEVMYKFSCRYPLQYLVNNTEMSV